MKKIIIFSIILHPLIAFSNETIFDEITGFPKIGDWELVRTNCIGCHSTKLITQQRASAFQWREMIRWMQSKHNLWDFELEVENSIVNWLAQNYPPLRNFRRSPIPNHLLPEG